MDVLKLPDITQEVIEILCYSDNNNAYQLIDKIRGMNGDGCIVWGSKSRTNYGYGCLRRNKQTFLVHRLIAMLFFDDYDESLNVLHKCDNPPCINPEHLFMGTQLDNIRDASSKGNMQRGFSDFCKDGHKFEEVGYYIDKRDGSKSCKLCKTMVRAHGKDRSKWNQ